MKSRLRYKNKKQNIFGYLLVVIVIVIVLAGLSVQAMKLSQTLTEYDERKQELSQELSDEQKRTKEIQEYGKYTQTDEYIEEVAREKLGLVKDDEIVFKNDSNQ